jgi:hypothetical protein
MTMTDEEKQRHFRKQLLALSKEARQLYGGRKPASYLPAHNHITHTPEFCHGINGFRRFWIPPEWVGKGWSKCTCGWMSHRPEWRTHYAHTDHVEWWQEEIEKRGSLDAVYRHIKRRLLRSGDWPTYLEARQ